MPISLTCVCGAKLEIDDSFAGRDVPCPDCERILRMPGGPPPLNNAFALASIALAFIGVFTYVGALLAIVCGLIALRQMDRRPFRTVGKRFATSGITIAVIGSLILSIGTYFDNFLRIDSLFRTLTYYGKLAYPKELELHASEKRAFSIKRPGAAWAVYLHSDDTQGDPLILIDTQRDAYIACMTSWLTDRLDAEACREEAIDRLRESELAVLLNRGPVKPRMDDVKARDIKTEGDTQEFYVDAHLGGMDRVFLVYVLRDGAKIAVNAGVARRNRFAALEPELRAALDSYKMEK